MVELDIQQTKDNNFICMHDATLDRTSTGKGAIKNYTTTELKQFVLKSGNGIKTRRSIPTLEEALMTCKDRILVNIDKGGTYIKEILPIIRKCGMEKQVIIKGRYPVEKVQEEYGTNTSMLYMPIIHLWKEEDIKATESFIKDFTPIAYELCFKDEQTSNLKDINKIIFLFCCSVCMYFILYVLERRTKTHQSKKKKEVGRDGNKRKQQHKN